MDRMTWFEARRERAAYEERENRKRALAVIAETKAAAAEAKVSLKRTLVYGDPGRPKLAAAKRVVRVMRAERLGDKVRQGVPTIGLRGVIGNHAFTRDWYGTSAGRLNSTTPAEVRHLIRAAGEPSRIVVEIDSVGGSIEDGDRIRQDLVATGARITTRVTGECSSAANIVLMAGDHREAFATARFMMHKGGARPIHLEREAPMIAARTGQSERFVRALCGSEKDITFGPFDAARWGWISQVILPNGRRLSPQHPAAGAVPQSGQRGVIMGTWMREVL